jgi:hypothetical protein
MNIRVLDQILTHNIPFNLGKEGLSHSTRQVDDTFDNTSPCLFTSQPGAASVRNGFIRQGSSLRRDAIRLPLGAAENTAANANTVTGSRAYVTHRSRSLQAAGPFP